MDVAVYPKLWSVVAGHEVFAVRGVTAIEIQIGLAGHKRFRAWRMVADDNGFAGEWNRQLSFQPLHRRLVIVDRVTRL